MDFAISETTGITGNDKIPILPKTFTKQALQKNTLKYQTKKYL